MSLLETYKQLLAELDTAKARAKGKPNKEDAIKFGKALGFALACQQVMDKEKGTESVIYFEAEAVVDKATKQGHLP